MVVTYIKPLCSAAPLTVASDGASDDAASLAVVQRALVVQPVNGVACARQTLDSELLAVAHPQHRLQRLHHAHAACKRGGGRALNIRGSFTRDTIAGDIIVCDTAAVAVVGDEEQGHAMLKCTEDRR